MPKSVRKRQIFSCTENEPKLIFRRNEQHWVRGFGALKMMHVFFSYFSVVIGIFRNYNVLECEFVASFDDLASWRMAALETRFWTKQTLCS